ncbi:MAG: AAA family ATPase [Actinomycetia bacterium]|nr:AAA family ATPase [Actinomycetes bacterium]
MADGRLIVLSGIMAAGKSTVAQALAERFPKSAHVRGDHYRRAIVQGRHDMSRDPTPEALDQLRLRYRLAASTAEHYRHAGFTTVVQDTILGPMLNEFVAMIRDRPLSLVVLTPEPGEVARREEHRSKVGYRTFTPEHLDAVLRTDTPRVGYWLDSTGLTVTETVDQVLANLDGAAIIT